VNLQALLDQRGYHIALTESDLNGPERFVADDVLTQDQCQQLIQLANVSYNIKGTEFISYRVSIQLQKRT
jgi:hypothetical protein